MGWTGNTSDIDSSAANDQYSFCGFILKSNSSDALSWAPTSRGFQAGTLSQMACRVTRNQAGVGTIIINGTTTTNQTISTGSNATGYFIDNTDTDTTSGGESISVKLSAIGASSFWIQSISFTFQATTAGNTVTRLGFKSGGGGSSINTRYYATPGESDPTTTETFAKTRIRKSFTIKNLGGLFGTSDTTFTVTSRKNGAAGALSGTTGGGGPPSSFSDSSHSDSVVSGDDWNFSYIDTSNFLTLMTANVDFISSNGDCIFVCGYAPASISALSTSTTNYFGLSGTAVIPATTESDTQMQVNNAFVFDQLICNVPSGGNTITASSTFSLRAGSNDKISVSIGANSSGLFLDSSTQYQASASDQMNYKVVTGATGTNIEISFMSVYGNTSTVVVGGGGPSYQHFGTNSAIVGAQYYQSFGSQMVVFGY